MCAQAFERSDSRRPSVPVDFLELFLICALSSSLLSLEKFLFHSSSIKTAMWTHIGSRGMPWDLVEKPLTDHLEVLSYPQDLLG